MSDIAALLTWTNIRFLLEGLGLTLIISALAIACSIVLGAVISIMRGSSSRLLRGFAIAYVELFKNTPLLLWIMFTFFVAQLIYGEEEEKMNLIQNNESINMIVSRDPDFLRNRGEKVKGLLQKATVRCHYQAHHLYKICQVV